MNQSRLISNLIDDFSEFEIIDSHEHLGAEHLRTQQPADVFTLFNQYTKLDLLAAGMPQADLNQLHDRDIPLETRWRLFDPWLERIRYGSFARPAFIAAKEFCDANDINADTYQSISEQLAEQNTPGIYDRLIRQKCRVRKCISCKLPWAEINHPLIVCITQMAEFTANFRTRPDLEERGERLSLTVSSLDDCLAMIAAAIQLGLKRKDVGLKMATRPYGEPNRRAAETAFARVMNGDTLNDAELHPLWDYLVDEMLKQAGEGGHLVCVHTGFWGDFRTSNATHMIPLVKRHPNVRFNLFHASMPYVRPIAFMAKNFPNVWLDLCWSHVCSPMMTRSLLNEWIDIVPANKITAFGGDYVFEVEKIYGHLVMARENIAHVLASRIEEGLMNKEQAINLAKNWLHDVPAKLYGV